MGFEDGTGMFEENFISRPVWHNPPENLNPPDKYPHEILVREVTHAGRSRWQWIPSTLKRAMLSIPHFDVFFGHFCRNLSISWNWKLSQREKQARWVFILKYMRNQCMLCSLFVMHAGTRRNCQCRLMKPIWVSQICLIWVTFFHCHNVEHLNNSNIQQLDISEGN